MKPLVHFSRTASHLNSAAFTVEPLENVIDFEEVMFYNATPCLQFNSYYLSFGTMMPRHIHVTLAPSARLDEVANALAISAGAAFSVNEANGSPYPRVAGLRTAAHSVNPGLASIEFRAADGDVLRCSYHFEFGKAGERGMLVPYSARWLALVMAVVEQFGGDIEIEEGTGHLDVRVDSRWPHDPEDEGFEATQAMVMGVRRVTDEAVGEAAARLEN